MKVLRAIGNFFARIGRWIRDTAWVQPLLIVGGIFAIIFSIPYITNWVGSWFEVNQSEKYYKDHQLSLKNCDEKKSEADGIFQYLVDISNGTDTEKQAKKYGSKFFLAFVQEGCSGCESGYEGFSTLQSNWNKLGYDIEGDEPFKLHSIFVDEEDKDIENVDSLFEEYFLTRNYAEVFEDAVEVAQSSEYCENQGPSNSSNTYWAIADKMDNPDGFQTPTTFLVDNENGIIEVLFDFEGTDGSDKYAKALTLCDAWNHKGIFTAEKND